MCAMRAALASATEGQTNDWAALMNCLLGLINVVRQKSNCQQLDVRVISHKNRQYYPEHTKLQNELLKSTYHAAQ